MKQKIVIASTIHPFVDGGATYIVDWLEHTLNHRGHQVEVYRFPFSDHPADILEQLMCLRLIDLSEHGERLITIRPPAHLIKHPRKVSWFIHHYRSAYDLWGTKYQSIPSTPEGQTLRKAILSADNAGLRETAKLFCNSRVVQQRLKEFNHLDAEVLYPPLLNPQQFHCGGYGDYLLYFSRLTHHKRQWLAIESMRHTKTPVRLVIAGEPDPTCGPYVDDLQRMIDSYDLHERVVLLPRWVPQQEKIELMSECLAAVYLPFDEDSYGYPSLEAHAAGKAVLTTTDSGGTNELIVQGQNGFITPPDPQLIAEGMDFLYTNRKKAKEMGEAGVQRIKELGIDWDHVVERLLS
jgi:glycosyltransferase involved in cell wall biosynthesis